MSWWQGDQRPKRQIQLICSLHCQMWVLNMPQALFGRLLAKVTHSLIWWLSSDLLGMDHAFFLCLVGIIFVHFVFLLLWTNRFILIQTVILVLSLVPTNEAVFTLVNAVGEVIHELVDPNANFRFGALVDEALLIQVSHLAELQCTGNFEISFKEASCSFLQMLNTVNWSKCALKAGIIRTGITGWILLMVEVSITFIATGFWAQEMFEL